jgi:hypothetical protein
MSEGLDSKDRDIGECDAFDRLSLLVDLAPPQPRMYRCWSCRSNSFVMGLLMMIKIRGD